MGGVKKEKAALRRELLARRDALPGRAEKSRAIQSRVLALPEYQRARRVLLYLSKGSEVDTWPLLDCALAQGKEVYAPRCLARPGEMAFYRVSSREDLQAGAFGLLEPIPGRCPPLERGQGDLCLVPGLAFTVEPGVYLEAFGVRTEVDVYLHPTGPEVTTPLQEAITPL